MREKIKTFFIHPVTKATILAILTVSIAILTAVPKFKGKWVLLITVSIIYIGVAGLYAIFEGNYYKSCLSLERQNRTFEEALRRINSICKVTSKAVNKTIHAIRDTGLYNGNAWNFNMACNLVCEQFCNCLCMLLSSNATKPYISVGYVKALEKEDKPNIIVLCAYHASRDGDTPRILHEERDYTKDGYHDASLFQRNQEVPELLLTQEEVREKFAFNRDTSKKKYKQFIGIPVFCDRDNGSKMVGLLEITCFNEYCFPNKQEEVDCYIDNFIRPFANLILLLHKMEKAILVVPSKAIKKEVTNNEK